jgi:hypothetical protein
VERREAALRRMLATPRKPHKPLGNLPSPRNELRKRGPLLNRASPRPALPHLRDNCAAFLQRAAVLRWTTFHPVDTGRGQVHHLRLMASCLLRCEVFCWKRENVDDRLA